MKLHESEQRLMDHLSRCVRGVALDLAEAKTERARAFWRGYLQAFVVVGEAVGNGVMRTPKRRRRRA